MSDYGELGSKVKKFERQNKDDMRVIYSDSTHICLMKLCPAVDEDPTIPLDDYKRFHIRFYIPRFVHSTKNKKVKKVIFMFNGLNELDHFTLYDQIGQVLCQQGIAAALIPLPDHLNRHTKWRIKKPSKNQKIKIPLDYIKENPDNLHYRFIQFSDEIHTIYNAVKNCHTYEGDFPFCFYRNIFDCDVRISCLGYSLGGLAALSIFLDNPNLYNACFLLNSGITLKDIKLPESMIRSEDWDDIVVEASERFKEKEDNSYSKIFGQLFLGNWPAETIAKIKPLTNRLLFIFGGADSVIPMESIGQINPGGKGLSLFQVPGISHFPSIDREWNNWYSLVVNLVTDFEENASRLHWSKQEMIESIVAIKDKFEFYKSPNNWDESKIKEQKYYDEFYNIYYSHSFFFPNFKTLLGEAILFQFERDHGQDLADKEKYCTKRNLKYDQIKMILKTQIDFLRKGNYKRCDGIARKFGFLTA